MKEVEEVEKRKEKKLIKKFLQHSKVLTALVITTIGGPMFGALTIRLLLPKYKYQIAFLVIGNIFSTILSVSIAKGIVLGFTK